MRFAGIGGQERTTHCLYPIQGSHRYTARARWGLRFDGQRRDTQSASHTWAVASGV